MATSSAAANHHHNKVSETCNLLSQYLKQTGSATDLNLVLSPPKPQGLATKNLLPTIEKSGQSNSGQIIDLNQMPPTEGKAEMTILYNGQVIVFNEFSPERAKEIMDLACTTACGGISIREPALESSTKFGASSSLTNGLMSSQQLCEGDMPIMRNASLARFIAKRKDRMRATTPYHINIEDACTTLDKSKTWLINLASTNDCHENVEFQLL